MISETYPYAYNAYCVSNIFSSSGQSLISDGSNSYYFLGEMSYSSFLNVPYILKLDSSINVDYIRANTAFNSISDLRFLEYLDATSVSKEYLFTCMGRFIPAITVGRIDVTSNTLSNWESYTLSNGDTSYCSGLYVIDYDNLEFFFSDTTTFITYLLKFKFST